MFVDVIIVRVGVNEIDTVGQVIWPEGLRCREHSIILPASIEAFLGRFSLFRGIVA
jgi:hypothetical protein